MDLILEIINGFLEVDHIITMNAQQAGIMVTWKCSAPGSGWATPARKNNCWKLYYGDKCLGNAMTVAEVYAYINGFREGRFYPY